ncbi:DNA alkylation repair enzyme [Fibrobacter sp. UWT2]|uniref:DNA alkylation repair protein n=1 Tax=Fibrobacter sp. UWT2 TaxID=1896224 RepID=UPI00090F23EC|nr:DNA alkylation repair protein [Fibrobacter sp. UWT2]SHL29677.1 DNA alkylation repair enzyme [Fibrobacter sp. UWT2]
MTHAELVKRLLAEQDLKYRDFHASLLPNIDKKSIIGVRVPTMRKIAKEFVDSAVKGAAKGSKIMPKDVANFLDKLPHKYFEENQVHLFAVERIKDFDECMRRIEQFLPYIDNWAVCDGKSPKVLLKDEARFYAKICEWLKSSKPYTVRFGVNMLMNFFLDERFSKEHLKLVAAIDENLFDDDSTGAAQTSVNAARPTDRYYVQMVIAWYMATALAKQWDATFPYIKGRKLSPWIHAKSIQKACESYRITQEQKEILRGLK